MDRHVKSLEDKALQDVRDLTAAYEDMKLERNQLQDEITNLRSQIVDLLNENTYLKANKDIVDRKCQELQKELELSRKVC